MNHKQYAQIQYDPNNLQNATVKQIAEEVQAMMHTEPPMQYENKDNLPKDAAAETEESMPHQDNGPEQEIPETPETMEADQRGELWEEETAAADDASLEEKPVSPNEPSFEAEDNMSAEPLAAYKDLNQIKEDIESIYYSMRRMEKKFDTEILNAETRDGAVKTMYKELNEYKAGLVEKALKNVLYDIADIRELIFARAKHIREKEGLDVISLDDFISYAEDMGDILEKYDVGIYKGESGVENTAVRQKIVRKIETEDDAMAKKVAESLSYGYEYNGKVLYPEKISIYVKKETDTKKSI